MALIKFGGGVAGISGKIGGTVFGRNKAGAYARNWAKPVNPVTPSQSAVRAIFGNASAGWGGLTAAQRDEWNSQAKFIERINRFGEVYSPSGRQYYMEIFNSLAQAGQASLTTPVVAPTPPNAILDPVLTATLTAGVLTALTLAYDDSTATADDKFIIEAAPIAPDTKTNINTQYRQIQVETAAGGSPINLLAAFTALFGTAGTAGNIARIRVTAVDTVNGLRSPQVLVSDVVA